MKNKTLLIVLIAVVAVVLIFVIYFSINSVSRVDNSNASQPLIGGQRDIHGCLIAAGYSWCEPKQKCLRSWEEDCYGNDLISLTAFFAQEHNQPVDQTHITIFKNNGNYFAGSIIIGVTDQGEGGGFLVRKINNTWQIDYEGNGSIDCVKIKALGYTVEVLEGFCD